MARTKVNEEEKEGAVGAKRVRKLELVATLPKAKGTKARKTDTKRVEVEEEAKEEPAAEEEEAKPAEEEEAAPVAEGKAEEPAAAAAEEDTEEKAKRRHRPGQAAKVRVRRARKSVRPRFALAAWARVVRSVAHTISPQVMFQASALTHLRQVAEGVALRVFQEAGILMQTSGKKRLTDQHVAVAAALRFQQSPGHTNAAYTQLHREGYEHFNLASAMSFDYFETKPKSNRKPAVKKEKPAEAAAAADE